MTLDINPSFSMLDTTYSNRSNIILLRNYGRFNVFFKKISYFNYLIISKSFIFFLVRLIATFFIHIIGIFFRGSEKKMVGVHAFRLITRMTNILSVIKSSIMKRIGISMGANIYTLCSNFTVTLRCSMPSPCPTFIGIVRNFYQCKKSIRKVERSGFAITIYRTMFSFIIFSMAKIYIKHLTTSRTYLSNFFGHNLLSRLIIAEIIA